VTFTAVVVSHANEPGLRSILGCLRYQTRPPDETIALCSNTRLPDLREDFPDVTFLAVENQNDWGHEKRATGLAAASCDWVGFFNDDDSYSLDYLERMLAEAAEADAVFCEWNENPGCDFHIYRSTAGNFIVRAALAKKVGWRSRVYEADGHFIEALNAAGARVVKVPELLYHHNAQ
jgi:hypothetical protein